MKRILGIAAIILFFLVILVLVIVKLIFPAHQNTSSPTAVQQNPFGNIPVTAQSDSQDPAQFSHDFYAWYLSNLVSNPTFPSDAELHSVVSRWITPAFVASWDERGERIDADPVLYAQDFPSSWGGKITARLVQQTDFAATVDVTVGDTANEHKYTVHLLRTQGVWRVDSIDGTV